MIDYRENPDIERGPLSEPTLDDMLEALMIYTKLQPDEEMAEEIRAAILETYPDADVRA